MQKLSRAYKDRPMTPQENVIYWTEYIIKHKGAPHLRTVAADIPTYQYLLLDVILLATVVVAMILFAGYYAIKKIFFFRQMAKIFLSRNNNDKKRV